MAKLSNESLNDSKLPMDALTDTSLILSKGDSNDDDEMTADDLTDDKEEVKKLKEKFKDEAEEIEEESNDSNTSETDNNSDSSDDDSDTDEQSEEDDSESSDDSKDDKDSESEKDNENDEEDKEKSKDESEEVKESSDDSSDDSDSSGEETKESNESFINELKRNPIRNYTTVSEERYKDLIYLRKWIVFGQHTKAEKTSLESFYDTIKINQQSLEDYGDTKIVNLLLSVEDEIAFYEGSKSISNEAIKFEKKKHGFNPLTKGANKLKDAGSKIANKVPLGRSAFDGIAHIKDKFFVIEEDIYWVDPSKLTSKGSLEKAATDLISNVIHDKDIEWIDLTSKSEGEKFYRVPIASEKEWSEIRENAYKALEYLEKAVAKGFTNELKHALHIATESKVVPDMDNYRKEMRFRQKSLSKILSLSRSLPKLGRK